MARQAFEEALEIPGYLCEELIGRGGMGSVYRATQLSHHRPVAIKILGEAFRDDPDFVERFRREAELLATLEHPHIVPMLESGEVNGVPFLVMRLIDGPNLREYMRHRELEPWFVAELLSGVAAALDFAHGRGVLHRDVKPHNMLLDHGAHVWLADFGLMRLVTDVGAPRSVSQLAGTFDYLAPELAAGGTPSVAGDVYALAVSAFQLLTGQLPFSADHVAGLLAAHSTAPRPRASAINPRLPTRTDSVLSAGMAVDPAARPASARAFTRGLSEALADGAVRPRTRRLLTLETTATATAAARSESPSVLTSAETAPGQDSGTSPPTSPLRRSGRVRRWRHRRVWSIAALVLLLAAAVTAGLLAVSSTPRPQFRLTAAETGATRFDYRTTTGVTGPQLSAGRQVTISCAITPTQSRPDGHWWYRLASSPWDQQFYAPASAFDNPTGAGSHDSAIPRCSFFAEIPGNPEGTHTWADPKLAGGNEGPLLHGFTPTPVLCRLLGLKVQDGNTWWYRLGGKWHGQFYVSADAFYNNGERRGTLHGTAFVDTKVPLCR